MSQRPRRSTNTFEGERLPSAWRQRLSPTPGAQLAQEPQQEPDGAIPTQKVSRKGPLQLLVRSGLDKNAAAKPGVPQLALERGGDLARLEEMLEAGHTLANSVNSQACLQAWRVRNLLGAMQCRYSDRGMKKDTHCTCTSVRKHRGASTIKQWERGTFPVAVEQRRLPGCNSPTNSHQLTSR